MSEIDAFVTDRLVSVKLRDVCATYGVNVIETSAADAAPRI